MGYPDVNKFQRLSCSEEERKDKMVRRIYGCPPLEQLSSDSLENEALSWDNVGIKPASLGSFRRIQTLKVHL